MSMVWDEDNEAADPAGQVSGEREAVSRRSVLRTAAGASAAGLVAGVALGALPAAAAARPVKPARQDEHPAGSGGTAAETADEASNGPVVVHVRDARTGEMDIFAGTSQTRLRDPALAARLVRASR